MVGCHHRLNGHEFEQAPGTGEEAWCAGVNVITQRQQLATEQQKQ